MSVIELYEQEPAACLNYDPLAPSVAAVVSDLIVGESEALSMRAAGRPGGGHSPGEQVESGSMPAPVRLTVEHIGSSAVPGCAGKGIIDLMLLYGEDGLDHAKRVLDSLEFQRQQTRDPFPETRPMRLGAVTYKGKRYNLHVHVISAASPEAARLRGFRNALTSDPGLRDAYIARKRAIIAAGVTDTVDYCEAKSDFICGVTDAIQL